MHPYINDQSSDPPKLKVYLNLDNLVGLPADSVWEEVSGDAVWQRLQADGFTGVQLTDFETACPPDFLGYGGLDRINHPEETEVVFARHAERGDAFLTLHVGWGMESDQEMDALVSTILTAQNQYNLPTFIETHRATITQDMWRTVELTKRFPAVRFNGDFSHLYCGQEIVYGDFEAKLAFLQPVFDRVGFVHGRIAAPGYMQAPIETLDAPPRAALGRDYLADFKSMWTRAMAGFLQNAGPGDVLIFTPELLRPEIYYARAFPGPDGQLVEESDRYAQALLYRQLAEQCFAAAQAQVEA